MTLEELRDLMTPKVPFVVAEITDEKLTTAWRAAAMLLIGR